MEKKKVYKILLILGLILVVITIFFIIDYYLRIQSNSCTTDPLKFAAKKYSEAYGYDFEGYAYLKIPMEDRKISPMFYFNSSSTKIVG